MAETAGPVTLVLGVPQRIELSGVADTLKRFDPPANARALRIVTDAYDLKIVTGGTDAAALGSTAYDPIFAKTSTPFPVPGTRGGAVRNIDSAAAASNTRRVCIAGPAAATFTITAVANLDDEANTANVRSDGAGTTITAPAMKTDDAALAPGAAFLPVGGIVDDTSTDEANEGDGALLRLSPRRALRAAPEAFVASGTLADGSASYQSIALTTVPDLCRLGAGEIHHTGDTTPATVTWKITRDSTGDQCIAGPQTLALEAGVTSGSKSGNFAIEIPFAFVSGSGTSGTLYGWVKYDAVGAGPTAVTMRLGGEYR